MLVNGSSGIVGMATNIPPQTIWGEVIDACLAYIVKIRPSIWKP